MKHERFDIHQHITDQIITAIEAGAGEFKLPWATGGSITCPTNIASKKAYRGVNIVALWAASASLGYSSGIWGTYRQWAETGAQVRRGEHSSYVVFYKELELKAEAEGGDGDSESETRLFARATPVFAAEQVDGYAMAGASETVIEPLAAADAFIQATGAVIQHGGSRAYYQPSTDTIRVPLASDFIGTATMPAQEAYYATLLHELTHWTSPEHRCDRQLGKRFGDDAYAMEELVAELGAAFLCAELGVTVEPRADHAQYLASWLKVLKTDKKAIFTAASKASQATTWLKGMVGNAAPDI